MLLVLGLLSFSQIDIDECFLKTSECDQECHDTPGSYECSCFDGYLLLPDGHSCIGKLSYINKVFKSFNYIGYSK